MANFDGFDIAETFVGGNGADAISGDGGNDVLAGGLGLDSLWGGQGNDTLISIDEDRLNGGAGIDTLVFNRTGTMVTANIDFTTEAKINKSTTIASDGTRAIFLEVLEFRGGDGNDTVKAYIYNDFLDGDTGNDYLDGGGGNDTVYGGAGNDTIFGGEGNDVINGGTGDDLIDAGGGDDVVFDKGFTVGVNQIDGGAGNDLLDISRSGSSADLTFDIAGGAIGEGSAQFNFETLKAEGGSGNDTFTGGGNGDTFIGNAGDDVMYGNGGNDLFHGGAGNDTIYGGDGTDIAAYAGNDADYEIVDLEGSYSVTSLLDGSVDIVSGVEKLRFDNGDVLLA